jgi:predicted negative regulator of RcsB-dependent stress response
MLFLIPVAVVGYKIWDNKQKEEEEAAAERLDQFIGPRQLQLPSKENETFVPSLSSQPSDISSDSSSNSVCDDDDSSAASNHQKTLPKQKQQDNTIVNQWTGFCRFVQDKSDNLKKHMEQNSNHNNTNPFRIRSSEEALTYEIMGNQGANALPFPKISYK